MARRGNIREAPPAVRNILVLGQGVGDQCKETQILLEGFGERQGPRLALGLIRALQKIKRGFNRQRLAIHLKAQVRHGFIKQAVEGAVACLGFFKEQFLELVIKLIGLLLPQVFNPWAVVIERWNLHGLFKGRIVNPVELKFKEQQLGRNIRVLGTHVAIKLAPCRIRCIPHIIQLGVRPRATQQIGDGLISLERFGEVSSRKLCQFPFVFFSKGFGLRLTPLHVGLEGRRIGRGIKVSEVPFRQITEGSGSGHVHSLLTICFPYGSCPQLRQLPEFVPK